MAEERDERVSITELHRITGQDRVRITRRLKNIPFTKGAKNATMYNRKDALSILMSDENDGGAHEAITAKARRETAEADRAELRVAQIRGELVSADAMRTAAAELVKTLYQRIVRVEPAIIAAKCVGLEAIEIETVIRDSSTVVFNQLRLDLGSFMSVDDIEAEIEVEDVEDSE
jgi:hypothetical protein